MRIPPILPNELTTVGLPRRARHLSVMAARSGRREGWAVVLEPLVGSGSLEVIGGGRPLYLARSANRSMPGRLHFCFGQRAAPDIPRGLFP